MTSKPSSFRRKLVLTGVAGVVLTAALAWLGSGMSSRPEPTVKPSPPVAVPEVPSKVVTHDPVKIFRKAFWRSPAEDDQVLHAERRDWTGEDGLAKWQWFLVVQPSPGLLKYLRDDNAFGLARVTSAPNIEGAPAWFMFKPSDVEVLQAPRARLILLFSKSGNLLYATDSGDGLRPGAPAAPQASKESTTSAGRLPATPPPDPR